MAADFTWYLRNLLLAKSSENMEDVLDVSTENLARLKEEAAMIAQDELIRFIRIFSELSGQLKYAAQKRVLLEVALIKLCRPQMEAKQDTLLARIRAIEEKLEKGITVQEAAAAPRAAAYEPARPQSPAPSLPKALTEDVKAVVKEFRPIANAASEPMRTYLKRAKLSVGAQDQLLIILPDELSSGLVGTEEHKAELSSLIENRIGKTVQIEVRHVEEGRHFEDSYVDLEQLIHMDITIEDE